MQTNHILYNIEFFCLIFRWHIQFCFRYVHRMWVVWPCQKFTSILKIVQIFCLISLQLSKIQTTLMSTDDLVLNQSRCKDFFSYEGGPQNFLCRQTWLTGVSTGLLVYVVWIKKYILASSLSGIAPIILIFLYYWLFSNYQLLDSADLLPKIQ